MKIKFCKIPLKYQSQWLQEVHVMVRYLDDTFNHFFISKTVNGFIFTNPIENSATEISKNIKFVQGDLFKELKINNVNDISSVNITWQEGSHLDLINMVSETLRFIINAGGIVKC